MFSATARGRNATGFLLTFAEQCLKKLLPGIGSCLNFATIVCYPLTCSDAVFERHLAL